MKILLVSPFTSYSGSAVRFWNIAIQLSKQGHSVVYVERKPAGAKPFLNDPDVRYYCSPTFRNLYFDILFSTAYNLFILLKNLDCTVYYALKPAPNNCIPALAAKLFGKRIFLDIDDLDYGYLPQGFRRNLAYYFFSFFPRFFEIITCHTDKLKEFIITKLKIKPDKIYFLAQGISQEFLSIDIDVVERIPRSIVYAATLGITSDFGDLIPTLANICKKYPDTTISIIGDGVRKKEFETAIEKQGFLINCTLWGRVPHNELPELIARHWIGINYMRPSLTNDCRAILKIREYLACGLQVVCNNVGDVGKFKEHIFIEGTCKGIEQRLVALLGKDNHTNQKGNSYIIDNYKWDGIIANFLRFAFGNEKR